MYIKSEGILKDLCNMKKSIHIYMTEMEVEELRMKNEISSSTNSGDKRLPALRVSIYQEKTGEIEDVGDILEKIGKTKKEEDNHWNIVETPSSDVTFGMKETSLADRTAVSGEVKRGVRTCMLKKECNICEAPALMDYASSCEYYRRWTIINTGVGFSGKKVIIAKNGEMRCVNLKEIFDVREE